MTKTWVSIAASAVVALVVSAALIYRSSPVWQRRSPFDSLRIRLLPVGIAVVEGRCDVCRRSVSIATWRRRPNGISVQKLGAKETVNLMRISTKPCVMYMEQESYRQLGGYNALAAYVQEGDSACTGGPPLELPEQTQ